MKKGRPEGRSQRRATERQRKLRDAAGSMGEAALFVPEVQGAVQGVLLAVLSIVFVPLGLGFLLLSGLVGAFVLGVVVKLPSGNLSTAIAIAWWIGTLILMFILFQRVYRWLRARISPLGKLPEVGFGQARRNNLRAAKRAPGYVHLAADASGDGKSREALQPTLAELDSRLAPRPPADRAGPGT